MPEVMRRDEVEREIAGALMMVWQEWTNVADPSDLSIGRLQALLEQYCLQLVWQTWWRGHRQIATKYELTEDEKTLAAAFLLFWSQWVSDLISRWQARITQWQAAQDGSAPSDSRGTNPTGQSGAQSNTQPGAQQPTATPQQPTPKPRWRDARTEILVESEVSRTAVSVTTDANTDGERRAVGTVNDKDGVLLVAIWRTEPGACLRCAELEGQPERVWQMVAPKGPKLHPNCRCWLEYQPFLGGTP